MGHGWPRGLRSFATIVLSGHGRHSHVLCHRQSWQSRKYSWGESVDARRAGGVTAYSIDRNGHPRWNISVPMFQLCWWATRKISAMTRQRRKNWWKWNRNLYAAKKVATWPTRSAPLATWNAQQRRKKVRDTPTSQSLFLCRLLSGVREVFEHAARAALARKKKRKGGCVLIWKQAYQ